MNLWLAIGTYNGEMYSSDHLKYISLGVCEASDENEAFYKFMQEHIYPLHVVELPNSLMTTEQCKAQQQLDEIEREYMGDQ